ncbi:MAG: two-component regulator propeller domain-containing protein, partial [Pyrinomonadaceae bacterium]
MGNCNYKGQRPDKTLSGCITEFRSWPGRLLSVFLCAVAALGFIFSLAAQSVDDAPKISSASLHQWGAVTLFHGLPSDRVRAITQDNDGAMWFGTDAGLARYDGRRTQTVTDPVLPAGRVQALQLDQAGAVWVGTEAGAARYLAGQFQSVKETEGKSVTSILAPSPGRIVLATADGTVFDLAVQNTGWTVRQVPGEPLRNAKAEQPGPLAFTSLAVAGESLITGSRSRGLISIDGEGARELSARSRFSYVEALERDAAGRLWMGTRSSTEEGGLFEATDPSRPVHIEGVKGTVTALRTAPDGGLWTGTEGQGVYLVRDGRIETHFTFDGTAGGLRSNNVYSIFVDREQVVWFGTDRGACRFDPRAWRLEAVSANAESSFVRVIFLARDGRLWCGTNRGLFVQDPGQREWRAIAELAQRTIYAISVDPRGRLLVGTASGLYASPSPGMAAFKQLSGSDNSSDGGNSVRAITQFKGKTYIAVFGRGIEVVEGDQITPVWPLGDAEKRAREVISLHDGADGRLWIGTATAGVFLFDGKGIVNEPALAELMGAAVRSIDGTRAGLYWLATSRGLFAFRGGLLRPILPDADTRAVMVAGDQANSQEVWCATAGAGLVKLSLDAPSGLVASTFDAEQGLPSAAVSALARDRGDPATPGIVIGTTRGLAHYEPGRLPPLVSPARVISKRLHSMDEVRNGLWLEYPQNSLLVDIAAASTRTFPEQFQYVFTLYDSAGKVVKQKLSRESQFSMEGLAAGSYRVQAVAYSADLVPSAPFEFTFNVPKSPFPWTVAALSLLLLLALFALLWANFEHHRIARTSGELARANQELADARLRLANEAESERRRIARDLHDQTLADLRRLMLMTDQLPAPNGDTAPGAIGSAAVRQEIESVSNEIRRICEDLSPSVLENVGFAAALEFAITDAVTHLAEVNKFSFEFNCPDDLEDRLQLAPSVKMQIYRIAQEAISNICRHAQAKRVHFTVTLDDEGELVLALEDDGKGIAEKEPTGWRGRGLAN